MNRNMSSIIGALLAAFIATGSSQGPLSPPPGEPAPTMKTLDQVEPRIPINATNTPGSAFASFRILLPGSYYLTGNVTGESGKEGIHVQANNVTIDLNGFSLQGVAGALNAIQIGGTSRTGITIRGGTITGWPLAGVTGGGISNTIVCEGLIVRGNGGRGLDLGSSSRVTHCSIENNLGLGLRLASASSAESCVIQGNAGGGAEILAGAVLSNSTVEFNSGVSILLNGSGAVSRGNKIQLSVAGAVGIRVAGTECAVESNRITGSLAGTQVGVQLTNGAVRNILRDNIVLRCNDNYDLRAGNLLEILIAELPESLDLPCHAKLIGSLSGLAGQAGLIIASDNVTIDLAGHTLSGVGSSLDGITVSDSRKSITVRNGTLRDWGLNGLNLQNAVGCVVENVHATGNSQAGIVGGSDGVISECTASSNGSDNILIQGGNCLLSRCTANNSVSGHGIHLAAGHGIAEDCIARENNQTGIIAGAGATIRDCTATNNAGRGISLGDGGQVTGCTTRSNLLDGILVNWSCLVTGNNCNGDGTEAGFHGGIRVNGESNRIDGNHITYADVALYVRAPGNTIIRNSLRGNTTAVNAVEGNDLAPFATAAAATNPWSNIQN